MKKTLAICTLAAMSACVVRGDGGEYAEIVNPDFPAGTTLIGVGSYVQTGLVAHFDAIHNVGADLPHDNSATVWKNLAGGPDAVFMFRTQGSVPTWTPIAYSFNNDAMAYTESAIDLGVNFAVQIAITAAASEQSQSTVNGSKDASTYNSWFNNVPKGNYGFWTNKQEDNLVGNFNFFVASGVYRPTINPWGGRYVTWMLDAASDLCYTFKTDSLPAGMSLNVTKNPGALTYCWGAELTTANVLQAFVKAEYHSVRMYTRPLTNSELAWNRIVDEARFHGIALNGCVIVASNRAGAEGAEASGAYYVNGNHTFTAPAEVTIGGCVYENVGYTLERYNTSNTKWELVGDVAEASFAYTNCAANAGSRITWNWRLKSGAKKIDADDYVHAGLLLHLDGIRNAGLDVDHDPAATTWKDLATGGVLARETFDEEHPGAWVAKGYRFAGGECFVTPEYLQFGRQVTLQVAADYNESLQTAVAQWPSFFGAKTENDVFGVYTYRKYATDRGDMLRFNSTAFFTNPDADIAMWDGRIFNAIVDHEVASNTSGPVPSWLTGKTMRNNVVGYQYSVGATWVTASSRKKRAFSGMMHAVRLYNRTLSDSELRRNWEIDNIRFYAGAGRYSGSNLVEVVCEPAVVLMADAGSWLIRGEDVSKAFTAPPSVTVGNCTYACTGYRLETWNAERRMWENPVETTGDLTVELRSTDQNRRLTWLYTITNGIRSAADYDIHDYVQQGLVANYDGIRNLGPGNPHAMMAQRWRDSSYRDVPMIGASNTTQKAWVGFGHHFTASEVNFFEMTEPISLGQTATIQSVMDTVPASQTTSYPLYFGFGYEDRSFFTRTGANRTRLEVKYPDWVGDNLFVTGWEGRYFSSVISPTRHYLTQGTELGAGSERSKNVDIPANKMTIGAPSTYPNDYNARAIRAMTGDYFALRIYNRALTEAELVKNRTVDEIRYRGSFANANVTVACDVPFEGVAAPVSMPAGEYEVTGEWTFTAQSIVMDGASFAPRYTVETWNGGEWGEPVEYDGDSYTYTAGAKVRLTWKWADPTTPITAMWTGGGEAGDLLDPANWTCLNAAGAQIENAVPAQYTTVVVDGTTTFSIPAGTAEFPWKDIRFGAADAHFAMRCGSYKLSSNANIPDSSPGFFSLLPASLTNLNGSETPWQTSYLKTSRVRYDGWFYVSDGQTGTWTIRQMFDDYFGFALDGEWLVVNNSYVNDMTVQKDVAEGWHRFMIVCGDTGGSQWGSTAQSSVILNGTRAPMAISWGGAAVMLTEGNFEFGSDDSSVITLAADCDWSALGKVMIANGATIDLNGHNLTLASLSAECLGSIITNSNDSVTSTVTFVAGEGATVTNDGAAICGNVKVVKKGAGTFCSSAIACSYTGGTFIDEGTAQPPDGNGGNTLYCYDQFKAFSTNEIYVAAGATFDLRANYAYRNRIVLAGGTLTNTKANMSHGDWGGSGIGCLTEDSVLSVPFDIVFGDNRSGDMDLGGHTLTADVGNGKIIYLRCSKIENGKIDFTTGGWLQTVNACMATNVDFRVNLALRINAELSVRDYEAVFGGANYTEGSAALNVYGTFKPSAGNLFYGCTMQDGSTIDLSGTVGSFSTASGYTSGNLAAERRQLSFAENANVTLNFDGREDLHEIADEHGLVMTWPEDAAAGEDVKFALDDRTKRRGFIIRRDDEANGIRLIYQGGTALILR